MIGIQKRAYRISAPNHTLPEILTNSIDKSATDMPQKPKSRIDLHVKSFRLRNHGWTHVTYQLSYEARWNDVRTVHLGIEWLPAQITQAHGIQRSEFLTIWLPPQDFPINQPASSGQNVRSFKSLHIACSVTNVHVHESTNCENGG